MNQPDARYEARIRKVLEYIDAHLDEELDLERLSAVAAFSKYHFHRQFRDLLGVSVFNYVQLRRMKRAAYRLAFRPNLPVLEIALDCAYDGPEAFARAFKKHVGSSPSQFRKQPRWGSWFDAYRSVHDIRSQYMQPDVRPEQVRIVEFPETKVAALEHRGDPVLIGDSIRKFVRWRKEHGLSPQVSATFNVFYVDIEATPAQEFRMDLCVSTDRAIEPNDIGVMSKVIPGGRCALLRHVGSEDTLDAAIRHLYAQWLPASGEEVRDYPLFLQRISFFPDVPEHEAITDIFLPLRDVDEPSIKSAPASLP